MISRAVPPPTAATFLRRAAAGLLDLLAVAALTLGLGLAAHLPSDLAPAVGVPAIDGLADLILHRTVDLLRWGLLFSGVAVAWGLSFPVLLGRTPGDWALGLQLCGPAGEPVHPVRALFRSLVALLALPLLGAAFWWAAVDRQRRALHDRLAGTHLLRVRKPGW